VRFDKKTLTSFRSSRVPPSFPFHFPIEIWIAASRKSKPKSFSSVQSVVRIGLRLKLKPRSKLVSTVWRGKLHWDAELGRLTTAALNSEDRAVRTSAIKVQLAAYGLAQNNSSVDALVRQTNSSNHAQKVWALWALGLLGNRGVETDRIVQVLTSHLNARDSSKELNANTNTASTKERREANYKDDEDSRVWAVEGLGLVGTNSTIAPLLDAMRNDPSKTVRERAACSLAESGMLSREQRLTAVPQLINDSDDPNLDSQTHAWAFQALIDITKQHLPNDSSAWRDWYQKSVASGQ
jgi:HEAT repeat protein